MNRSADYCLETAVEKCAAAYDWLSEAMDKCDREYVDSLDVALAKLAGAKRIMRDAMDLIVLSQQ